MEVPDEETVIGELSPPRDTFRYRYWLVMLSRDKNLNAQDHLPDVKRTKPKQEPLRADNQSV